MRRKALPVISFALVVLTTFPSCKSLDSSSILDLEAHNVINDMYGNRQFKLYYKTVEEPQWDQLINFDTIFSRVGLPTRISDADLEKILNDDDLENIRILIRKSKPSIINGDMLDGVQLLKRKNRDVVQISTPIVYGNIAFLRRISENEVPIYILKKENGTWDFLYTFYQKLILY